MSNQRAASVRQHEALRVPQGWKDQDRALVIQIERILDDLYTKFGRIRLTDLADELQEIIRTQGSDIEALQQGLEETDQAVSGITEEALPSKADKVIGATNNNFAAFDAEGNLQDSGHKHGDYLTQHQDISGKADKVIGATNNNFAAFDAEGNLQDSGHKHGDYLTQHQDISGKADKSATVSTVTYNSTSKKITKTINGNTTDVVDASTLKSAMAPFTWGQLANK